MGGGGLRILGHKKWHVWRRENIERVHRDEREHEEKQLQLQAKQRGIEQERRAHSLQNKKNASAIDQDGSASVPPREHINFFMQEEEQQLLSEASSAGVRKRDHKSSRHSQETLGRQGHLPWYAKRSADSEEGDAADNSYGRDSTSRREQKHKRALEDHDPLKHMRPRRSSSSSSSGDEREGHYSHRSKRSRDAEERTERVYKSDFSRFSAASELPQKDPDDTTSGEPKSKKPKKSKKDKKSKGKSKSKSKTNSEGEGVMQQLRREREERERHERKRADALMNGR